MLVLYFDDNEDRLLVKRWLVGKHAAGKPAWLLQDPALSHVGANAARAGEWSSLRRTFIVPEYLAPATRIAHETTRATLFRMDRLDAAAEATIFGVAFVWAYATTDSIGPSRIGLRWYRADDPHELVGDNRWELSLSLFPDDAIRVRVPRVPDGLRGERLSPGDHDVQIGIVREGCAWFPDGDHALARLPAKVSR